MIFLAWMDYHCEEIAYRPWQWRFCTCGCLIVQDNLLIQSPFVIQPAIRAGKIWDVIYL
jgi:hypothetical protein